MKILLDMNLSPSWKGVFDREGIVAMHWSEIGAPNAPDSELFSYAQVHGFIVFTHDLDFSAILAATNARFPSVIQIRDLDITPSTSSVFVLEMLREYASYLEEGALLSIDRKRARVHILPFNPADR